MVMDQYDTCHKTEYDSLHTINIYKDTDIKKIANNVYNFNKTNLIKFHKSPSWY